MGPLATSSAVKNLLLQKMLLTNFECKERQLTMKIKAVVLWGPLRNHFPAQGDSLGQAASLLTQACQTFMNPEVLTEALGGFGGTGTWLFCFSHCTAVPLGASLPPHCPPPPVLPDMGSFVHQLSQLNS